MAQTRIHDDAEARAYTESVQLGGAAYHMNRAYWMREGTSKCYPDGRGVQCSFFGPLDNTTDGTANVTKDSYLTGRGQPLSGCPECQVRWLPRELFDTVPRWQHDDWGSLTPDMRSADVCDSVTEQDATAYALMPRGFQDSFTLIFGANGRGVDREVYAAGANGSRRAAQQGVTSYGYYPRCANRNH